MYHQMNPKEEKKFPLLASGSLTELKEKCLNLKCPQHNLKITSVVILPDGFQQFLCKLCKSNGSNEKTFYFTDPLDDDFIDVLIEKIEWQIKDAECADEKHNQFFQFLERSFQELQREIEAVLTEAKERLKKKYLTYDQDKSKRRTNWADIMEDFEYKKTAFLQISPLTQSEQLSKPPQFYTMVIDSLQNSSKEKDTRGYKIKRDEIPRFLKRVQTQADILSEELISFNFGDPEAQIKLIDEEADVRGVLRTHKVINDLNMFATGSVDGELRLWDIASSKLFVKFRAHEAGISALLYVSSKKLLITGSSDRTIKVFKVLDGKINVEKSYNTHRSQEYCWWATLLRG